MNYTYDGDNWRTSKSGTELDWYDASCQHRPMAETDLSGNPTLEYIYMGQELIAKRNGSGSVYYLFGDRLRSSRVMTDASGFIQQESDYYPFGGERMITNNVDNRQKFTSKKRDMESGLDYSRFRMLNSNVGRWNSIDPVSGDPNDPQTLNAYSYVANDPTNSTDPTGSRPIRLHGRVTGRASNNPRQSPKYNSRGPVRQFMTHSNTLSHFQSKRYSSGHRFEPRPSYTAILDVASPNCQEYQRCLKIAEVKFVLCVILCGGPEDLLCSAFCLGLWSQDNAQCSFQNPGCTPGSGGGFEPGAGGTLGGIGGGGSPGTLGGIGGGGSPGTLGGDLFNGIANSLGGTLGPGGLDLGGGGGGRPEVLFMVN